MMREAAFVLDTPAKREQVLEGLLVACRRNQSVLWAAHVRVEHVHVVIETDRKVERAMADLKAWATRALRRAAPEDLRRNYWARHGSTRYLFNRQSLQAAIVYVIEKQGIAMTTYLHPEW
jgi:REP element-mobilizing transposase RayT